MKNAGELIKFLQDETTQSTCIKINGYRGNKADAISTLHILLITFPNYNYNVSEFKGEVHIYFVDETERLEIKMFCNESEEDLNYEAVLDEYENCKHNYKPQTAFQAYAKELIDSGDEYTLTNSFINQTFEEEE